jgi:hypothetical protein
VGILNEENLNSTESEMPLAPNPFLATFIKALSRAVLFSLSIDHVLIDFLARTIIEAATGLLAILVVGIRRSPRALRRRSLQLDPYFVLAPRSREAERECCPRRIALGPSGKWKSPEGAKESYDTGSVGTARFSRLR